MSASPLRPATTRFSKFGTRPINVNRSGASSRLTIYSWLSLGKPQAYLKKSFIPNPNGFQFPQDQPRVQRMADLSAYFGQDRLKGVSVKFILYAISRVRSPSGLTQGRGRYCLERVCTDPQSINMHTEDQLLYVCSGIIIPKGPFSFLF